MTKKRGKLRLSPFTHFGATPYEGRKMEKQAQLREDLNRLIASDRKGAAA